MSTTLRIAASLLLAASAALLGGALAFQYLGGLAPCVLCVWQRYAHGAVIGLMLVALYVPPRAVPALVAVAAAALLVGAGIAFFHIGVEQHWWQGTAECGSSVGGAGSIEELRARLMAQPIVRCDEISWSLFGLSMAGYNFILSVVLAGFASYVAWRHHLQGKTA
jgi:disulfide bond formation protein DsbB